MLCVIPYVHTLGCWFFLMIRCGELEQIMQCIAMLRWLHCPHEAGVSFDLQTPWSQGCIQYRNALFVRLHAV